MRSMTDLVSMGQQEFLHHARTRDSLSSPRQEACTCRPSRPATAACGTFTRYLSRLVGAMVVRADG
jgi:hypothetical protein